MSAKVQRHRKIRSLVAQRKSSVESIADLTEQLQSAGFKADEETVAKDVQELGIVEVSSDNGNKLASAPTAKVKNIRIAPRKVRLVIDLIRGKSIDEAFAILRYTPRAASPIIEKVLRSAVANAEHNYNMDTTGLVIQKAVVDEGPTLKRFIPRGKGRAGRINKRTSSITVVVNQQS